MPDHAYMEMGLYAKVAWKAQKSINNRSLREPNIDLLCSHRTVILADTTNLVAGYIQVKFTATALQPQLQIIRNLQIYAFKLVPGPVLNYFTCFFRLDVTI